ncbi:MAG TPA: glycosyltransferase family 4 protein [Bacteroidota bacterium]|nr:glycosyltransferase family 4 protein [Bacteroidota bacterium]
MTQTHAPRKVLMIAYYFPPMGLSGVQRTLKFAKYLPKYGWKPTILTVAPTGYYAIDESLLREVEELGLEVVRTSSLDVNRLFKQKGVVKMPSDPVRKVLQFLGDMFFIPDTKIGWKSKALKNGMQILQRDQFDLIFATAPPQTDFLIGLSLKKQSQLPLVLDYRDAWLENPFKYFPTPLHRYLHKRLEMKVLKACDRVIVTHRRVKETILKKKTSLSYHDVVIISQGYDPEDFDQPTLRDLPHRKMRVVHCGTFYGGRNPSTLLRALYNLFSASTTIRGRIEVAFVGNTRREDQDLVAKLGLQNDVTFHGYLEHRESVKKLLQADVTWFILDNDYQTPGKLYEYFGARKPLLASVVDGYIKQLILESGAATCVPPNDVAAHEEALKKLFQDFENKKLGQIPQEFAERFNRVQLAGELAKQFESLMDIDKHAFTRLQEATA